MNCDAYFLYIAVFKKDLCVEVGFIWIQISVPLSTIILLLCFWHLFCGFLMPSTCNIWNWL
jgi:hypothetical protein